jgi:hypothetical protein
MLKSIIDKNNYKNRLCTSNVRQEVRINPQNQTLPSEIYFGLKKTYYNLKYKDENELSTANTTQSKLLNKKKSPKHIFINLENYSDTESNFQIESYRSTRSKSIIMTVKNQSRHKLSNL